MLHRFGKTHRAGAGAHSQHAVTTLLRRTGMKGAAKAAPLRAASSLSKAAATTSSSVATATAAAPATTPASMLVRPQFGSPLNGLFFRAQHQSALRRLFSSAASRASSASASSSTATATATATASRFSRAGGALAAATLIAAGVALSQSDKAARADGAAQSTAATADVVLPPSPAVPGIDSKLIVNDVSVSAALPSPSGSMSLKNKKKKSGSKKAASDDDEVRIDPVAPTFNELGHGALSVTEFHTWNGIDLKFAYTPLPPTANESTKTKDFSLVHHIALGSPLSKEEEPTAVYDLTGIVALGFEKGEPTTALQAKIADTGVEGMVKTTFFRQNQYLSPLSTQLQFATTGEDNQPVGGNLETNYHGRGYTVDMSYRLRPSVGQLAYIQNIPVKSWKCALGAEFGHAFDSQNSALSYAGRAMKGPEQFGFTLQPWTYSILSYQRRFESSNGAGAPASGVVLATDLHYSMVEHVARVSAGLSYQLHGFFNIKASANTSQQISSSLEAMLGPAVSIGVCGDVKHAENKYAFGLSLGFGGG